MTLIEGSRIRPELQLRLQPAPRHAGGGASRHDAAGSKARADSRGLQAKINEQAGAISRAMLGTQQQVLVEGRAKRNADELSGRTGNNRVVNFPGPGRLIGRFVDVTITGALPHSLRAEIVA
jgi:tRNA A37 methylthiotransferase MiaB